MLQRLVATVSVVDVRQQQRLVHMVLTTYALQQDMYISLKIHVQLSVREGHAQKPVHHIQKVYVVKVEQTTIEYIQA